MRTDHELILLLKKNSQLIDPAYTFKRSSTFYTKKMTRLEYQNGNDKRKLLYFVHEEMTHNELGYFMDEVSKSLHYKTTSQQIMLGSKEIPDRYKKLLDQFNIQWLEMDLPTAKDLVKKEEIKNQTLENHYEDSKKHDALVTFTEGFLRADLNTSWDSFSLLVSNQYVNKVESADKSKERVFQIYYQHQLKFEGSLEVSYQKNEGSLLSPNRLTVHLSEIISTPMETEKWRNKSFELSVDLESCIDWKSGRLFTEIPFKNNNFSADDMERMEYILQKWNLHHNYTFALTEYKQEDLEYFTKKLVGLCLLKSTAQKKTSMS